MLIAPPYILPTPHRQPQPRPDLSLSVLIARTRLLRPVLLLLQWRISLLGTSSLRIIMGEHNWLIFMVHSIAIVSTDKVRSLPRGVVKTRELTGSPFPFRNSASRGYVPDPPTTADRTDPVFPEMPARMQKVVSCGADRKALYRSRA